MDTPRDSSGKPRLFRLSARGRERLLAKYASAGGRQRFIEAVPSLHRRTAGKIFDGGGVLYSKMALAFEDLDLDFSDRDCEPVPNGETARIDAGDSADSAPAVQSKPEDLIPESSRHSLRLPLAVRIGVAALALLALFLFYRVRTSPSSAAVPPSIEDRIRRVVTLGDKSVHDENPDQTRARLKQRARAYLALMADAWHAWYGRDEQEWVEQLGGRDGHLRWALEWFVKNDPALAVEMAGYLVRYWVMRGEFVQRRPALELAADLQLDVPPIVRARGLAGAALSRLESKNPNLPDGLRLADEALRIYRREGDPGGEAYALRIRALLLNALQREEEAARDFERAAAIYRDVGDRAGLAMVHYCRTFAGVNLPDLKARWVFCAKEALLALRLFQEVGNHWGIEAASNNLMNAIKWCPYEPETAELFDGAEQECRRQMAIAATRSEHERSRGAWIDLSRLALVKGEPSLLIECIFGVTAANDLSSHHPERFLKVYGAISRHAPVAEEAKRWARDIRTGALKAVGEERGVPLIEGGRKLSLQDALKLAMMED